jgi:hypothetical protein
MAQIALICTLGKKKLEDDCICGRIRSLRWQQALVVAFDFLRFMFVVCGNKAVCLHNSRMKIVLGCLMLLDGVAAVLRPLHFASTSIVQKLMLCNMVRLIRQSISCVDCRGDLR